MANFLPPLFIYSPNKLSIQTIIVFLGYVFMWVSATCRTTPLSILTAFSVNALLFTCNFQCKREGFLQKVKDEEGEGCNIYGFLEVNKVAGNFHFAPGKSFQQSGVHVHDLLAFQKDSFNVSHIWWCYLVLWNDIFFQVSF